MFRLDFSYARRIASLAGPVMLAMLSQTVINQIDHILVGHLPESEATPGQTAVQLSQILLWMFGGFLAALAVGTQALTARRVGENDPKAAGKVATNMLLVALTSSVVLGALCWYFTPQMFQLHPDPKVREIGIPFMRWRFLHIPSMVLFACIKAFFDAQGKTRVAMVAAILMNVLNVFLCVGLVYGPTPPGIWGLDALHRWMSSLTKGGLPRMGVAGAGLAAMICSYVGMIMIVLWSFTKRYKQYGIYHVGNLSKAVIKKLVSLSIPSGFANLFAMLGFGFVIFVVGQTDKLAGHAQGHAIFSAATSNIINILLIVFMSCVAYGSATATLVSQSLGAKKPDEAKRYVHTSLALGIVLYGIVGCLLFAQARTILHFWNPAALDVLNVATPIFRLMACILPVILVAIVLTQALYGAGNTRYVMVVEMILHIVCLMPLCYVLAITVKLGVWGAWIAMVAYIFALATSMYVKFRSGTWQHIHL